MIITKRGKIAIYIGLTLIVLVLAAVAAWFLMRPRYVVTSRYVQNAPTIDGRSSDPSWQEAETTTIPNTNDTDVEMKAVYTDDRVFMLVKFASPNPNMQYRPWVYDGKAWEITGICDTLAFLFVIDKSMPEFVKNGFEVVTAGLERDRDLYNFVIRAPADPKKNKWDGPSQKADFWLWGAGVTNPWGKAEDRYFAADRNYELSPTTVSQDIVLQKDSFESQGVLELNSSVWDEAKKAANGADANAKVEIMPTLMLKDGMNNKDNPYPYSDQMIPIPTATVFKKGDEIPMISFSRKHRGLWGGSRDDVDCKGVWKDGYWTIEVSRVLNTKNPDDIRFMPSDKEEVDYDFALLTRNDGRNIIRGRPAILEFQAKGGNQ